MKPSGVKEYREKHNLEKDELAKLLGCSIPTIKQWEQGNVESFSPRAIKAWAKLGVVCDPPKQRDYFGRKPKSKPPQPKSVISRIASRIVDINGRLWLKDPVL